MDFEKALELLKIPPEHVAFTGEQGISSKDYAVILARILHSNQTLFIRPSDEIPRDLRGVSIILTTDTTARIEDELSEKWGIRWFRVVNDTDIPYCGICRPISYRRGRSIDIFYFAGRQTFAVENRTWIELVLALNIIKF